MTHPSVSVIVPAYNAQDTIFGVIGKILSQPYEGEWELIIVDDGSTDRTPEKVQAHSRARYIRQDNAGPASARNRGASAARGEILLFTDSDCYPCAAWIKRMVSGFTSEKIGVVSGSYDIANPGAPLSRAIHAEILYRHRHLMPEFPRVFGSYNFAVRRDVFERAGGFNENYRHASGEDNDLSYKILSAGYRIRFLQDALVAHVHQEDIRKYLKEQFRHGFWRMKIYADHPRMSGGDDYTFWKDMIEIPLAWGHGLILLSPVVQLMAVLFFLFEIFWGVMMARRWGGGLVLGGMMWARSFARSAGLACGVFYFLKYRFKK